MTTAFRSDPWVAELLHRAEYWARSVLGIDFGGYLRAGCSPENDQVQSFLCDQIRIITGSLALNQALWARGIRAQLRMGHSLGEISALAAAGWIDIDTALRIVCLRSRAIVEQAPTGGMVAVNGTAETALSVIASRPAHRRLALSTVNGPSQVTVSGTDADLAAFEDDLKLRDVGFKRLIAKYPFHGPLMAPAAAAFARSIARERFRHGAPVWSPILGRPYGLGDRMQELIAHHLTLPVMFGHSVHQVAQAGLRNWVEVGGRKALTGLAKSTMAASRIPMPRFFTTSLPGENELIQVAATAAALCERTLVAVPSPFNPRNIQPGTAAAA